MGHRGFPSVIGMGFVWVSFVHVALQILLVQCALSALLLLLGFFLTSSFGNPTVYLSIIRAMSDSDASFFLDQTAAASQYMMQSSYIPPLADLDQSF